MAQRQPRKSQRNRGSIIVTMLMLGIVMLAGAFVCAVLLLQSNHMTLKNDSERLGLETVSSINKHDRIGQMNNMVCAARELVFDSRRTQKQSLASCPQLSRMANLLMEDAREGAQIVDEANEKLIGETVVDIKDVLKRNDKAKVENLILGYADNQCDSNVSAPSGNKALLKYDTETGSVNPATSRYFGNRTLSLPFPDQQYRFKISAIPNSNNPTDIKQATFISFKLFKQSSPLFKAGKEQPVACEYAPSAVLVDLIMKDTSATQGAKLTVSSTAAINGSCPPPWAFEISGL